MTTVVKKSEVLEKVNALQAYSQSTYDAYITKVLASQTSTSSTIEKKVDISTFFDTLKSALDTFFEPTALSGAVQSVLGTLKCDLIRRSFKFEKTVDFGFPTDYPNGYNDLASFLYNFSDILGTSNTAFYSGFYWTSETSQDSQGQTQTVKSIQGNKYIDTWISKLTSEKSREVSDLENVASWCKGALGNFFVVCQTENLGNIREKMEDVDAYAEIYLNRGLYDTIKGRELNNHIPSAIEKLHASRTGS